MLCTLFCSIICCCNSSMCVTIVQSFSLFTVFHCMIILKIIYPFMADGYLNCSSLEQNSYYVMYLYVSFCVLICWLCRSGIACSYRFCQTVFRCLLWFVLSTTYDSSPSKPTLGIVILFNFWYSDRHLVVSHCGLNLRFSDN